MTMLGITKKIGIFFGLVVLFSCTTTVFGMQRSLGRPLGPCQNGKKTSGVSKKNTNLTASRSFAGYVLDSFKSGSIEPVVRLEDVGPEESKVVEPTLQVDIFLSDEEEFVVFQRPQPVVMVEQKIIDPQELIIAIDDEIGKCIKEIESDRKTVWDQCCFAVGDFRNYPDCIEDYCKLVLAQNKRYYKQSRVFEKSAVLKKPIALLEDPALVDQTPGAAIHASDTEAAGLIEEVEQYNKN